MPMELKRAISDEFWSVNKTLHERFHLTKPNNGRFPVITNRFAVGAESYNNNLPPGAFPGDFNGRGTDPRLAMTGGEGGEGVKSKHIGCI